MLAAPTSLPLCSINGNADMYGLGIRLGFYLQLLNLVMIDYVLEKDERESEPCFACVDLKLFSLATFIAVVIQGHTAMSAIECYITMLLICVLTIAQFFRAILHSLAWTRHGLLSTSATLVDAAAGLSAFVISIIFWITQNMGPPFQCTQHAFFFAKVDLRSTWFTRLNLAFMAIWTLLYHVDFLSPYPGLCVSYTTSIVFNALG